MAFQAKFTAIAVNLKRIANLIRENERGKKGKDDLFYCFFIHFRIFRKLNAAY